LPANFLRKFAGIESALPFQSFMTTLR